MVLSFYTAYQTRPIHERWNHLNKCEPNSHTCTLWHINDPGVARSIHLRGYRMAGQALFTAFGVGVVALGVVGMMGILPIGSVGSIAMLSVGGLIMADGLIAFVLDGTRGRLSSRFHGFVGLKPQWTTVDYTYGDKTYSYSLERVRHPTFFKSKGWKVKVTKSKAAETA